MRPDLEFNRLRVREINLGLRGSPEVFFLSSVFLFHLPTLFCFFFFIFSIGFFNHFENNTGYLEFFFSLLNLNFLKEILFLNQIKLID
jgi:hypothetical protein